MAGVRSTDMRYLRKRHPERVSPQDMTVFFTSLAQEGLQAQTFFLLCAVVPCRVKEAATLQWDHLDLTQEVWHRPGHQTATRLPHLILKRLRSLPRQGSAVFQPERNGSYWSPATAHLNWGRVYARAKLDHVILYDIRRTWAEWQEVHDPNIARLDSLLSRLTAERLRKSAPPVPMISVRVGPAVRRSVMRRVLVVAPLRPEWPG